MGLFDRFMDALNDATDRVFDSVENIRGAVEDTFINAEFYAKEFKNSLDGIRVYSQSEYGRKTYLKDEIDYMKYNAQECKNTMKKNYRIITNETKAIIKEFRTIKEKVNFVVGFFNISEAEALQLMYDNCLIDDRDKAEFYR